MTIESPMEFFAFTRWRKRLFNEVNSRDGVVLEIGVGSGKNISFYGEGKFVAFDISEKMISRAKARKRAKDKAVELLIADVKFMPFKDEAFDVIISTLLFA
ncbi:MAG: class I SAM-dependent methyltransferase [Methanocellales archaeon]